MMTIEGSLCRSEISASAKLWAGVTLTAPVPKPLSTLSSAMIGISLFVIGSTTILPIKFLYLSSFGFTVTAVSPSIVSGRVVATNTNLEAKLPSGSLASKLDCFIGYLIKYSFDCCSRYSISKSDREVWHLGHQFITLSPWYIQPFLW